MDINKVRLDTPHCSDGLFLNSAGSSLPPSIVNQTIIEYLQEEERVGGYKLMDIRANDINEFYGLAAKMINASARNIAFANSATDAYGKALSSIPFKPGDIILTSDNDYISNFIQFDTLIQRFGVVVKRVESCNNGDLDLEHMLKLIEEESPKLIAITHIPTNSGLIQDAVAVGELCRKFGILYLLDACQSIGQLDVDVQKIGCDFLSMTGRKFMRAPRGTGFLYVADHILERGYAPLAMDSFGSSWVDTMDFKLVDDAKRFEFWEKSDALKLGLKEAIRYAIDIGLKTIMDYNASIREHLLRNLKSIPGIEILDMGSKKANIITLRKENIGLDRFQSILDEQNVSYSITRRQHALIDFDKKGSDWAIRFSPHYFNTIHEMDQVSEILLKV